MPTLRELLRGTQKLQPKSLSWVPDGNNSPLMQLDIQPFIGVNNLVIRSKQRHSGRWGIDTHRAITRDGIYSQVIRLSLKGSGRKIPDDKPRIAKDRAITSCQCSSYYYYWWYANKKVKAHDGANFKAYVRKTPPPPAGRPEKNPCFVGDTKIKLMNGESVTIEYMANNPDKEYWVYSYDLDKDKIAPGEVFQPRITAHVNELIEVTLDSGKKELCTKDHLWLTRSGEYVEAQYLKENQSLMPLYTKFSDKKFHKIDGYEMIKDPNGEWVYTHRRVTEYIDIPVYDKKKQVRHHVDFNKLNNNPSNLMWMGSQEHFNYHSKMTKKLWEENPEYFISLIHSEEARNKRSKTRLKGLRDGKYPYYGSIEHRKQSAINGRRTLNKLWKTKEFREARKEAASKSMIKLWKNEKFRDKMSKKGKDNAHKWYNHPNSIKNRFTSEKTSERNVENWKNEEYREKMTKHLSKIMKKTWELKGDEINEYRASDEGKISYQRARIINLAEKLLSKGYKLHISWDKEMKRYIKDNNLPHQSARYKKTVVKYFKNTEEVFKECSYFNHKVSKIKLIKLEKLVPVYDISVPEYNNFSLDSGVFVHNSNIPGMCKHLVYLMRELKKKRVII